MAIECLDPCEELPVVPARDEDLVVRAYRSLEDAERTRAEFVLLEFGDFVLAVFGVSNTKGGGHERGRRNWGGLREVSSGLVEEFSHGLW